VLITGGHIVLEPLGMRHVDDLLEAAADDSIWRWMPVGPMRTRAEVVGWVQAALDAGARAEEVTFAIVLRASGRAVGSTRFLDITRAHRRMEIGWTWIAREHQRTRVNTEAKYLLLRHAFEDLGAVRVQFKTDLRNEISQQAMERLGAVREGVMRRHMILWDGWVRDSVYYGITDLEWPAVRERLLGKLASRAESER